MKKYLFLLAAPVILLAAQPQTDDLFEEMMLMQQQMAVSMEHFREQVEKERERGHTLGLNAEISKVDLKREGDHYKLTMPLPGAFEKGINIRSANHILTVSAEREEVRDVNESNGYRYERSVSSYARSISVPKDADTEHMKSSYENGVLTITMPKKA